MPRLSVPFCLLLLFLSFSVPAVAAPDAQHPGQVELKRWRVEAQRVRILRDTTGVPHIFGQRDSDAVFGLLYAQAEDDFHRVEVNYINGMGRMAEVEGESALFRDLRMHLFIDTATLKSLYLRSPPALRKLMDAWADGLNYYLYTHPTVKPALIRHFEPWMALSFSEGSIGGDIESVDLKALEAFYGNPLPVGGSVADARTGMPAEPRGSNGFAISPARSASGHALLLINPHTSFYFRAEVHVVSEEGLNVYGAVTWGQFFIYQGFNEHLGWMHTSGGGDAIDEYLETVTQRSPNSATYRYGDSDRPLRSVRLRLPYRTPKGMAYRNFTVWFSHHGPIVRQAGNKWVAVRMMNSPLQALTQSFQRTKARNYTEFRQALELRTNTSNNTVYADAEGNTALFYGNFVPVRDARFDWTQPVDGSDPATDWRGLHPIDALIQVHNPATGWIQNTNNTPFNAAGAASPHATDFPAYMSTQPENPRGVHAAKLLSAAKDLDLDRLIALAYDPELTAFAHAVPAIVAAYDALPDGDPARARLAGPIQALRSWDLRSGVGSVPTSLAIYWAQDLAARTPKAERFYDEPVVDSLVRLNPPQELLQALERTVAKLSADFGSWQTPWGEINRFQRLSGDIDLKYDDQQPSLPIGFTSGNYGSLAAFGTSTPGSTKRIYGDSGNSFVAVVEFGPRLRARSLLAGGESGDPASPHFLDQAERYSRGEFKTVLFYPEDIEQHLERRYHPGE